MQTIKMCLVHKYEQSKGIFYGKPILKHLNECLMICMDHFSKREIKACIDPSGELLHLRNIGTVHEEQ